MKKGITILVLLLTLAVQGQTTETIAKNQMAKAMSLFVENVKPAYQKGQSYSEFEKMVLGTWSNTPVGTALLSKAFGYISKGISTEQIAIEDSGIEMTNALSVITNSKSSNGDGMGIFGGSTLKTNAFSDKSTKGACKWYQIMCYIEKVTLN